MDYHDSLKDRYVPLAVIRWDISGEPHAWHGGEFDKAFGAMPEKIEATDGMIFFDERSG